MYMANDVGSDIKRIESSLKELDVVASRPFTSDSSYDFIIESDDVVTESDTFNRAYVFGSYQDIYDTKLFELDQSGIMLVINPEDGTIQACRIADYRALGLIAFDPIQEYFNSGST